MAGVKGVENSSKAETQPPGASIAVTPRSLDAADHATTASGVITRTVRRMLQFNIIYIMRSIDVTAK
jgi:hypothetical protein